MTRSRLCELISRHSDPARKLAEILFRTEARWNHEPVLCSDIFEKAKNATQITTSTMVVNRPWKQLHLLLLSPALLASYQQPIAAQHFKSTRESTLPVTAQMVNLGMTEIHDDKFSLEP
jgi:hypothetical protein